MKKEGVPILHCGITDKFLSEWAIKEYGQLGKLIEEGTYYVPTYMSVDQVTLPTMITLAEIDILETSLKDEYADPRW